MKAARWVYLIIVMLFLYLPILTLMVFSFNDGRSMFGWTGFSLKWYREMLGDRQMISAIINTFAIAVISSVPATLIGTSACLGISAMRKKSENFIMGLNSITLLNADIVTGISLMLAFIVTGFYLNMVTVILAHITFSIPYVVLSVMPKVKQLGKSNYEAALDLGATPAYAFRKVVLPELRPGIISGFLLAFTMSVDDFVITHFTRGAGINTISTLIYGQVKVGIRPTLFALSTLIFVTVMIVLTAVNVVSDRPVEEDEFFYEVTQS